MPVNMYDLAAEMPIMSTYVPINFGELYRIATTLKAAVDLATKDIGEAILRFGEFTSPSDIDVQNYYDRSIGQMLDLITAAMADPDRMKDAAFRSELYSRINGLDYAELSRLREGADALRTRQENIARMTAAGTYNPDWDTYPNLSAYDTLSLGILDELAPVAYMSANDLSDPYYSNLTPGTIGSTFQNGVKYQVTGNTVEDLLEIANARYSDIVRTPQGLMYYQLFLRESNNDPAEAERRFKSMIVASLMDRTLRPTLTVDPAWLAAYRASRSGSGSSDNGAVAQRLDLILKSFMDNSDLSNLSPDARVGYRQRMSSLNNSLSVAEQAYRANPSDENLQNLIEANNAIAVTQYSAISESNRTKALNKFNEVTGSYLRSNDLDNLEVQRRGISGALDEISTRIGILDNDAIVTNLGATYNTSDRSWSFADASRFITPETMYSLTVTLDADDAQLEFQPRRHFGQFGMSREVGDALPIGFKEALESGLFTDVRFIPSTLIIQDGPTNYALKGKLYIEEDQVDDVLSLGWWRNFFTGQSMDRSAKLDALKDFYGMKKVKKTVDGKDVDYYEFSNMYMQLPSTLEQEWWAGVQTMWQNSGGIGGSSQAKQAYESLSQDIFGGY